MKFAPFIAVTIAIGAAVGWLAPGAPETAAEEKAAQAPDSADRLDVLREDQWSAGETALQRAGDGHFYAEVTVGSDSTLMMVDTGASMIALTGEDAETLGVDWSEDAVRPVAKGASGTVYGVPVTLDHVELGSLEASEVEAVVVPDGLDVSLLGQSFLSRVRRVEIDGDTMLLGG